MLQRKYVLNGELKDPSEVIKNIKKAVCHPVKINGKTHNYYKYPACFPPEFPREVIRSFSKQGDLILDPFMGGGTSAVEAISMGRDFVGVDINPLSVFVTKLKTIDLSPRDIEELDDFFTDLLRVNINDIKPVKLPAPIVNGVDQKFINIIAEVKRRCKKLNSKKAVHFSLGVLLRECKMLCDNPYREIDKYSFIEKLFSDYQDMLEENITFNLIKKQIAKDHGEDIPKVKIYSGSMCAKAVLNNLYKDPRPLKLVVTSPPYPGKHVLYHKWQADGRKENYLPQWIIDSNEYESENKYVMGGRSRVGIETYFNTIKSAFSNIAEILEPNGIVVQAVAFSDRRKQLPAFLDSMSDAGFKEVKNLTSNFDRRLWREVPYRKWHATNTLKTCKEVVLFHTLK